MIAIGVSSKMGFFWWFGEELVRKIENLGFWIWNWIGVECWVFAINRSKLEFKQFHRFGKRRYMCIKVFCLLVCFAIAITVEQEHKV